MLGPSTPCHTRSKHGTTGSRPCPCRALGRPTGPTRLGRGQADWLLELTATSARRPQISPCAVAVAGRAPCMACGGQSPTQTGSQPAPARRVAHVGYLGGLNERWRERPSLPGSIQQQHAGKQIRASFLIRERVGDIALVCLCHRARAVRSLCQHSLGRSLPVPLAARARGACQCQPGWAEPDAGLPVSDKLHKSFLAFFCGRVPMKQRVSIGHPVPVSRFAQQAQADCFFERS